MRLHESFASALRLAREACGLSQAELAERIDLSVEAYGRLERGRVLPRAVTLVRIAGALNVTTDELLGCARDGATEAAQDRHARAFTVKLREATPEDLGLLTMILTELTNRRRACADAKEGR